MNYYDDMVCFVVLTEFIFSLLYYDMLCFVVSTDIHLCMHQSYSSRQSVVGESKALQLSEINNRPTLYMMKEDDKSVPNQITLQNNCCLY